MILPSQTRQVRPGPTGSRAELVSSPTKHTSLQRYHSTKSNLMNDDKHDRNDDHHSLNEQQIPHLSHNWGNGPESRTRIVKK